MDHIRHLSSTNGNYGVVGLAAPLIRCLEGGGKKFLKRNFLYENERLLVKINFQLNKVSLLLTEKFTVVGSNLHALFTVHFAVVCCTLYFAHGSLCYTLFIAHCMLHKCTLHDSEFMLK